MIYIKCLSSHSICFCLVPLYVTKYFMVEEYVREFFHTGLFRRHTAGKFWYMR